MVGDVEHLAVVPFRRARRESQNPIGEISPDLPHPSWRYHLNALPSNLPSLQLDKLSNSVPVIVLFPVATDATLSQMVATTLKHGI